MSISLCAFSTTHTEQVGLCLVPDCSIPTFVLCLSGGCCALCFLTRGRSGPAGSQSGEGAYPPGPGGVPPRAGCQHRTRRILSCCSCVAGIRGAVIVSLETLHHWRKGHDECWCRARVQKGH